MGFAHILNPIDYELYWYGKNLAAIAKCARLVKNVGDMLGVWWQPIKQVFDDIIVAAIAKCLWLSSYKQDMLCENIGDKIMEIPF